MLNKEEKRERKEKDRPEKETRQEKKEKEKRDEEERQKKKEKGKWKKEERQEEKERLEKEEKGKTDGKDTLSKIKKEIERFHMLKPGDKVLVGVSGGGDSICLLQALFLLRKEYSVEVAACHCHHRIRGLEADGDASFVEEFCKARNIPCFFAQEPVADRARKKGISLEEAGREFRHETFLALMEREGFSKLAVAHNADDRAETMLFHLARGTNLSGLCSMEPVRPFGREGMLVRPLLGIEKKEIETWLLGQGLDWRTDSTNLSDLYTRNQIRHHVLPGLRAINGKASIHMGEAAEAAGEAARFLDTLRQRAARECLAEEDGEEKGEKEIKIRTDKLSEYHDYLKKALLHQFLSQISGSGRDLSRVHVELLMDLAQGKSGRKTSLPGGVEARKEYGFLILSRPEALPLGTPPPPEADYELITKRMPNVGQEISKKKYTKFFDCDKITNRLHLRSWQQGDYIHLTEEGGKKKIARYFIDEKIPQRKRGQILLLADGKHILWIVGYRISAYYKVTAKTKNLLSVTIKRRRNG